MMSSLPTLCKQEVNKRRFHRYLTLQIIVTFLVSKVHQVSGGGYTGSCHELLPFIPSLLWIKTC